MKNYSFEVGMRIIRTENKRPGTIVEINNGRARINWGGGHPRTWIKFSSLTKDMTKVMKDEQAEQFGLIDGKVEAAKLSKNSPGKVFNLIELPDGDFIIRQGETTEAPACAYKNGTEIKKNMTKVSTPTAPSKASKPSPAKKVVAKKVAPVKKVAEKRVLTPGSKLSNQPFTWIIELVEEKKQMPKDLIRKALEKKEYSAGTVNTQMSRLNRCPRLKVVDDVVKFVK